MLATANETAPYEDMGPSLLAKQPTTQRRPPNVDPSWDTVFTHLESLLGGLRSWRWSWWVHWRVLAEFFIPRRYVWLVVANRMSRGSPINNSIIDSTGQLAVRACASGMWTGLTSPSRPWFKLEQALSSMEIDSEAKEWLEDTEKRVYTVLHQSNFYSVMRLAFEDTVVFGTAPVIIYEDSQDVVRFYLPACGEHYLQVGARFDVTTIIREFTLTVSQLVEQFTLEHCPAAVAALWQTGGASLTTEFVVCHAIEPNYDLDSRGGGRRGAKVQVVGSAFEYREVYWLKGTQNSRPLSKRGFRGKPFMTLRWSTVSNDAYGRGPCMDALGDTKQVQLETRHKGEFIVKGVRPPMGADPSMRNEPSSITPGAVTFTTADAGRKGFWPLFEPNPIWLSGLTADIDTVNRRIEKCLFVEVFMAISRMEGVQPRNELELTQRNLERLQELGPVVDLAEKELSTLIKRVLDIMRRRTTLNERGEVVPMLKPMPESLKNVPLKINYTSIMKLAQRAAESIAMKDTFATAGGLSSAAKAAGVPDPIRVLDLDKSMRHYADLNNYPADCIFTIDEVQEHDDAREQAKAKAEMPGAAMAGVSAAKTLSETAVPGGTLLNSLMTGSTGPQ